MELSMESADTENAEAKPCLSMELPPGTFVTGCDLDALEPYCEVVSKDECGAKPTRIRVPDELAYFLRTHWCGSQKMHDLIEKYTRQAIWSTIMGCFED